MSVYLNVLHLSYQSLSMLKHASSSYINLNYLMYAIAVKMQYKYDYCGVS